MGYLIKDTTREEREAIVAESLGNIGGSCDGCAAGLAEMYQDYIDGKLSFYLSAVDGELKSEFDNPTLGLLLCKGKDKVVAEYALQDINKPIGISEYRVSDKLGPALMENLPSIEDIENRMKI